MHISFSEILVILLVALLVIKPERLPEVATVLARWMKNVRNLLTKVKQEVELPLGKYSFHEEKNEGK
jgi:sec-independent protein translocase protein TatB